MKALFTKLGITVPGATGPVLDSSKVSYLFPQDPALWQFGPNSASLVSTNGGGTIVPYQLAFPPSYGTNYAQTQAGGYYALRTPFFDTADFVDVIAYIHDGEANKVIAGAINQSDTAVGDVLLLSNSTGPQQLRWIMRAGVTNARIDINLTDLTAGQCLVLAARIQAGVRSIYIPGKGWASEVGTRAVATGRNRCIGNSGYTAYADAAAARFSEYGHWDGAIADMYVVAAVNEMVTRCQARGLTVYGT